MNGISYRRVSTDDQANSLENQVASIRKYCAFKGITIVAEIEDDGISGGINKKRNGFMELLDRVEAGGIDVIVLYSLERLSRDMLTLLALERLLAEHDVKLFTAEGQIDTSSPDGFMNFAMKAFLGEMERRQVKYRTKRVMQRMKENGRVVGTVTYGYERQGNDLIPNLPEQAIMKTANAMYQDGKRLVDIVNHLNESGTRARNGKPWTPQQVKRIVEGYENTFKKSQTKLSTATRQFIEAIA